MSVKVMTLVWSLDLPDSEKLVLLALADCANDEGRAWPAMRTLVGKCSKSDRTIQHAIKGLVEKGHLSRIEKPGKGCEYYIHPELGYGMEGSHPEATHYTYRITCRETGEFYVGARSCYGAAENDPYMGSGEWVKNAQRSGFNLAKEIVATFPGRGALAVAEQELTKLARKSPLCKNRRTASHRNLSPFGGLPPEDTSPRSNNGAKATEQTPEVISVTPEAASDKPSKNHQEPSNGSAPSDALTPETFVEDWNDLAEECNLVAIRKLSAQRRRLLQAKIKEHGFDEMAEAFAAIRRSSWMHGTNDRGWRANITWFLRPNTITRLIEGEYEQQKTTH